MMSLWCMFRSPLMVGANLPDNDEFTLKLLTNPEILRMHRCGTEAHQVRRTEKECVWTSRDAENGEVYLALFNLADEEAYVGAELSLLGLSGSFAVRDLWAREEIGEVSGRIGCSLPPHGAAVFALR